jgi:anthranilate phosphoribosyltransferase
MLEKYLSKVVEKENLNAEEAENAMRAIMSGEVDKIQTAAFLASLRMKGETEEEIAAFARVMRDLALKINPKVEKSVDVCGTGGDAIKTFNISTTAAFITACVVPVAKHGNRSVTSKCGSADLIEELGVNLALPPRRIEECIEKVGIGFMFAPLHHQAMKNVMEVRQKLGMRTVFNILGPLTTQLSDGEIRTYFIKPGDFGVERALPEKIAGGDRKESARILRDVLSCKEGGAKRDVVLLNAAAAIFAADEARSIGDGFEIARDVLEDGRAAEKLEEFVRFAK